MAPIKSIEYFRVKPRWLFVKVTDSEDKFGWGEATLEGHTQAVEGALDEIIGRIVGYEAEYVFSIPMNSGCLGANGAVTSSTSGRQFGDLASIAAVRFSCPPCRALISRCGT